MQAHYPQAVRTPPFNAIPKLGQARRLGPEHIPFIEHRVSYFNYFGTDATVCERNGMKLSIPRSYHLDRHVNNFIVRVDWIFSNLLQINVPRLLSVAQAHLSAELELMQEALSLQANRSQYGGLNLTLEYSITLEELRSRGGSVYLDDVDVVVSLLKFEDVPPHPYSAEGLKQKAFETSDAEEMSYGVKLRVIDNTGTRHAQYVNMLGHVHKLIPEQDDTLRDGVYLWTKGRVSTDLDVPEDSRVFYPFGEIDEKFGLYDTYVLADSMGNVDLHRKEQLAKVEHDLVMSRQQHEKEKQEREAALLRQKQLIEENELLNRRLAQTVEVDRMRSKDYYEERALRRKDSSDLLKAIPAVITGLGTLAVVFKMFFMKSSSS